MNSWFGSEVKYIHARSRTGWGKFVKMQGQGTRVRISCGVGDPEDKFLWSNTRVAAVYGLSAVQDNDNWSQGLQIWFQQ